MAKKFAAFFSVFAFAFAMMAGVSNAGDRPDNGVSLSDMSPEQIQEAMLQTGN